MGGLVPDPALTPAAVLLAVHALGMLAAAGISAGLIRLLRPWLLRYALARPNARSSHKVPTPQGGGIAVVTAALAAAGAQVIFLGGTSPAFAILAAATVALALLGGIDDVSPLSPAVRFPLQIAAVALVVWAVDPGRILPPAVPLPLERAVLVLAGTWWVNLVNFMDGIDWITIAEFVPLTAALVLFGVAGELPPGDTALAAGLLGGLLGFAPANRPVARIFLGDVGSLPIGLLSGAVLLALSARGHLAAALLLPLYYLADATLTLGLRARRRERIWEAHRSHFYQRALGHGLSVAAVDARVLVTNLVLTALAAATIRWPAFAWPALVVGAMLVAGLLHVFATPRSV